MDNDIKKKLSKDPDGLLTYEYIANNIGECDEDMSQLIDNMMAVDATGQFIVSAARYLAAIGLEHYREHIDVLVAAAIDKDREHKYIADLLPSVWGTDYAQHVDELCENDNNFRRIYKRLKPSVKI